MLKQQLLEDLKRAVKELRSPATDIVCSIPQNPTFGDYTTNIALQLAKQKPPENNQSALEIAKTILEKLGTSDYLLKAEIAGPGFINFYIKPTAIARQVEEIMRNGSDFGKNQIGQDRKIQIEFISANPTGPLTLANGRGGALGDTLANILSALGFQVDREYYINDTGNQIRLLGESVLASVGKLPTKKEHYQGEYIKELAEKFKDDLAFQGESLEDQRIILEFGHRLADYLLEQEIKPAIKRLGVSFSEFYSERSVYRRGLIEKTLRELKEKKVAYEKDGAVWFKSGLFGDEKDRVLMTSEVERGRADPTYFMADIAHHLDDLNRGYAKRINILGADHHGYGARIKGAMEALGFSGKIEIILVQFVKLFKGNQEVKMSKRAGTFVTLNELLDAVGRDVARFFFLMYAPDSHINFDLDLAKERSNKNPVYYVQYAHARMSNILSRVQPRKVQPFEAAVLDKKEELALIKHLTQFPELIEELARTYQVQKLTVYAIQLADLFHRFYENHRVLNAETKELAQARLALVKAAKIVLANTLGLLGVTAPERM